MAPDTGDHGVRDGDNTRGAFLRVHTRPVVVPKKDHHGVDIGVGRILPHGRVEEASRTYEDQDDPEKEGDRHLAAANRQFRLWPSLL